MNESISEQWINSQNKYTFLKNLKLNKRLYTLFACACVRQIWNKLTNESKNAITITELFVDNKATRKELKKARDAVWDAYSAAYAAYSAYSAAYSAAYDAAAYSAAYNAAANAATYAANAAHAAAYAANAANAANAVSAAHASDLTRFPLSSNISGTTVNADNDRKEMIIIQGKLLESIIQPNLQYNTNWSTSTVKLLTQQIYNNQDWNLLPILADALQDNNCTNDELLFELRNGNLWCKGNKLLDEIIEKR